MVVDSEMEICIYKRRNDNRKIYREREREREREI